MHCLDSRRLTGPNLLWDKPSAVIDAQFENDDAETSIEAWRTQVHRMLPALDWQHEKICVRRFKDGASLAISAPVDALYAATDVNDWAFAAACDVIAGKRPPDVEPNAARLRESISGERNLKLLAVKEAADTRNVPVLADTENMSLGLGCHSQTWALDELPDPEEIVWDRLGPIPVALVTGTNGKTTSVRLAASIAEASGFTVGLSCTDWIAAGEVILDTGDYAGPGGARSVLRNQNVDLGILETARGGLLRRGLAVTHADVVLITNVAADHLGEFGINDVDELADVKWVATRAADKNTTVVLNADDPRLVARAKDSVFNILWFSPRPDQAILTEHVQNNGTVCTLIDNRVTLIQNGKPHTLLPVTDIPITLKGHATHNIYNVLGVTGLAIGLGLPSQAIVNGLRRMQPNDNPGRSNVFEINGATVIVDFAHNPHGMDSFIRLTQAMPAQRRCLLIGQAGDRSDADIRELVASACKVDWEHVVIKEMGKYARGRETTEVAKLLHTEFINQGLTENQINHQQHEFEAVQELIENAREGDLIVLLIHEHRHEVLDYLNKVSTTEI